MNGIFMLPAGGHLQPTVEEVPQDLAGWQPLPPTQDQIHHLLGGEDVHQSVCEATGVVGHNVCDSMAPSRPQPFQAFTPQLLDDFPF